jgi:hypothetical protein
MPDALEQAFQNGQLNFQGDLKFLAQTKIFAARLGGLFETSLRWRRISNHRLVSLTDGQVTLRVRDSAHHNEQELLPPFAQ